MKTPISLKSLAVVSALSSIILVALSALPAAAAAPERFSFPEVCKYVPAPFNKLVCFSQTGRFSHTDTPSGKTITHTAVTSSSTVYDGRSKYGSVSTWSETTQEFDALVKNGEPVLFHVSQLIKDDNAASQSSCMIKVRLVITGTQIRQVYADASCT